MDIIVYKVSRVAFIKVKIIIHFPMAVYMFNYLVYTSHGNGWWFRIRSEILDTVETSKNW